MKSKKNLSLLLIMILLFSIILKVPKVYATEVGTGSCKLTFSLSYNDNTFNDNITVNLKDIATDKEYNFVITPEDYNSGKQYEVVANTTYSVKISFPRSNELEIINSDSSKISSYHATESGLNLKWKVDKKSKENENVNNNIESENIKDIEADKLFKTFQEKISFIENNDDYKEFIMVMSGVTYKNLFLEIEGNTEEKWDAMSKYQQACYSLMVTEPQSFILGINSNTYAKDNKTFISNLDLQKNMLNIISNGDQVYEALVEVWNWHWNNWETERTFINIYNEIDEDTLKSIFEDKVQNSESNYEDNNIRSELTSKETFIQLFKDNIITLIILIGVGIALYVVYTKNKKNNYDDSQKKQ